MEYRDFEKHARTIWSEIPPVYLQGIDGLIVDRSEHVEHDEVYTLGHCLTESYPSEYGGPDTIRSSVVLYYGSFRALAEDDPDFDWEDELRETLMHELQHHLEDLAAEDALQDFDYAVTQNIKRLEGKAFDPLFYRAGEQIAPQTFRVEHDIFQELVTRSLDAQETKVDYSGISYRVRVPADSADVVYARIANASSAAGDYYIVRVVRAGVLRTLRAALGRGRYTVNEVEAVAERA